jgi:transglutaminase-like putative cysteine protease
MTMRGLERSIAAGLAALMAMPPGRLGAEEPKGARDLVAETDALVASIPAERYDVEALAATLGGGVEPAFAFVRDRIGFEAYDGVLRGAAGALASEAGNAFDRSLLLAALLRAKDVPVRFAFGALAEPDARRLVERIFDPPSRPAWTAAPGEASARPGEPELARAVRARASRDYRGLATALGDRFPRGTGSTAAAAAKDVVAHAWVQAKVGDAWIDLDTAFADATPGRAFAKVEGTADEVPEPAHQTVTVRVGVETLASGMLAAETVFEHVLRAVDVVDALVLFGHAPPETGMAGAVSAGAQGDAETWRPFLWVDGVAYGGKDVVFVESARRTPGPPTGGIGGALRGLGGGRRDLVAEWLEVEVATPGGRRDVSRRTLLDRAGPLWRAAGTKDAAALKPLPRAEKAPTTPRELHVLWFSGGRHDLGAAALSFRSLFDPTAPEGPDEQLIDAVWPLAVQSAGIAVVSDHLLLPSLDDLPTCRFYADSPRLLLFTVGPVPGRDGESQITIDLPRDVIRGVARTEADEPRVAARKVWFGCLQGALEHEFVAAYGQDPSLPAFEVVSTSSLHADAGLVAVTPGARSSAATGERAARVQAVLAAGRTLVAPPSALADGPLAWWEVAPDGTTRTVLDDELRSARGRGYPPYRSPPPPSATPEGPVPQAPLGNEGAGRPIHRPGDRPPHHNRSAPPNPGANDPTRTGPPPRSSGGGSGGGSSGGSTYRSPPRPPGGPMRNRPARNPNRRPARRGGGNEWVLIIVIGSALVIGFGPQLADYVIRSASEAMGTTLKDILSGSFIADQNRQRRR